MWNGGYVIKRTRNQQSYSTCGSLTNVLFQLAYYRSRLHKPPHAYQFDFALASSNRSPSIVIMNIEQAVDRTRG